MRHAKQRNLYTLIAVIVAAPGASTAAQQLAKPTIAVNEEAAIEALRTIAFAQMEFVDQRVVDSDNDGLGEYGYLGELAGTAPLREYDPATGLPILSAFSAVLTPPLLPHEFADPRLEADGVEVTVRGYRYKIYLGDFPFPVSTHVPGLRETGPTGYGGSTAGYFPDADACELYWACYAWPDRPHRSGNRAFFVNQDGIVLETANDARSSDTAQIYGGRAGGPAYDAALSDMFGYPNAITGMGALLGIPPEHSNDGNVWRRAR